MRTFAIWLTFAFAVTFITGCGSRTIPEATIADAQRAFDQALVQFQSKDYSGSLVSLEAALKPGGGLSTDQYVDALLIRAACFGLTGTVDKALADLDTAEQGASNIEQVYLLRSLILLRDKKMEEAKQALADAKKFNPNLKTVDSLEKWTLSHAK